MQHHLLERSYRPLECLQSVPFLTTHPCALPCLYVWVRHCTRRITVSVEWMSIQVEHTVWAAGSQPVAVPIVLSRLAHCHQRKCDKAVTGPGAIEYFYDLGYKIQAVCQDTRVRMFLIQRPTTRLELPVVAVHLKRAPSQLICDAILCLRYLDRK